jgi:hypothetical protein
MRLSAQGGFFLNNILFDPVFINAETRIEDVIIIIFYRITVYYKIICPKSGHKISD